MFNTGYQLNFRLDIHPLTTPRPGALRLAHFSAWRSRFWQMVIQAITHVVTLLWRIDFAFGRQHRFYQVDYRNFRSQIDSILSGRICNRGRDTYLYDYRNRLVAIKRAAKVDVRGRCSNPCYFIRAKF